MRHRLVQQQHVTASMQTHKGVKHLQNNALATRTGKLYEKHTRSSQYKSTLMACLLLQITLTSRLCVQAETKNQIVITKDTFLTVSLHEHLEMCDMNLLMLCSFKDPTGLMLSRTGMLTNLLWDCGAYTHTRTQYRCTQHTHKKALLLQKKTQKH